MSLALNLDPRALRHVVEAGLKDGTLYDRPFLDLYGEALGDPNAEWEEAADKALFEALVELTVAHVEKERNGANKRGRPARSVPAVKWKVSIRHDLALYIDMLLADPVRGGLGYGERSALIERLTLDWARKNGFKG